MSKYNWKKVLLVLAFIGILLTSSFVGYLLNSQPITPTYTQELITLFIEPTGPIQLQINQTQIFKAITNQQDNLSLKWSLENPFTNNQAVNETNYLLVTKGNQALFKILTDDTDVYLLHCIETSNDTIDATVTILYKSEGPLAQNPSTSWQDKAASETITQNYYSTNVYNLASAASYIIRYDNGFFTVINGTTGQTIPDFTSDSANKTLNKVVSLGGSIAIRAGDYSGAELHLPGNCSIYAEPGVKGIKYASITDGARIDEPNFNAAFGKYTSGTSTIVNNRTSSATDTQMYLAFSADNSIYFASENATTVINKAIDSVDSPKIFIKNGRYIVSGKQPLNYLNISTILHTKQGLVLEGETTNGTVIQLADNQKLETLLCY